MAFITFPYLVFLPLAVILHYLFPPKYRWAFLLLASAVFYGFFSTGFLLLLLALAAFNYTAALGIVSKHGKGWYLSSLLINIAVLAFYKYVTFLADDGLRLARLLGLEYPESLQSLVLPLGLSFFVFTCLSYLMDVKKRVIEPETNLGKLASYLLFFPKLVQGPIERAGTVLPRFNAPLFDARLFTGGLQRILWGLFKKLMIADRFAPFVNAVYSSPAEQEGISLLLATLFFAFQIYADFSAYTDIAIGSANLLGIRLSENFRQPYRSVSVKDFWNRWHISFSQWLRDYLFLPLAYSVSRRLKAERYLQVRSEHWIYLVSTVATFSICGIWHGVGWNYLIWGLLFAFYLSFAQFTMKPRKRLRKALGLESRKSVNNVLQMSLTFMLVCFAWIFFRAASPADAWLVIKGLFAGWNAGGLKSGIDFMDAHGLPSNEAIIAIAGIILLLITDSMGGRKELSLWLSEQKTWLRWGLYYLLAVLILVYGVFGSQQFIYMQF